MNYDGVRLCGVADHLGDVSSRWPIKDVTVYAGGKIGEVNMADAIEWAIKQWNAVCGIRLTMSTNPNTANILVRTAQIDGRGKILAQSGLPVGYTPNFMPQIPQEYDPAEDFVLSLNPPVNKIDLGRTSCHELGHALGCGHISMGNLMAPIYSTTIYTPQNGDIMEMRARYGDPIPVSPPSAQPPIPTVPALPGVPGGELILQDAKGDRWKYVGFVRV